MTAELVAGYYHENSFRSMPDQFAERTIIQTKGSWATQPLLFEDWQRQFLREFYVVDEHRRRIYREALLGVPRKNGKSTLAAALGLHALLLSEEASPEIYVASGSRQQARVVFDQARDFVRVSPLLRDRVQVRQYDIVCHTNMGVMRVLSSDAPRQHGLNPSFIVLDELHAFADRELYVALTTAQLARSDPQLIAITTAGFDRSSVCWEVYERGRAFANQGLDVMRENGFLFKWYQAPDDCDHMDPDNWMLANPSSWVTPEVLRPLAQQQRENDFRRLHLNQWTQTDEAWITNRMWLANFGIPIVDPHAPTWIGFDLGVKRDSTAIMAVQWHGDQLHVSQRIIVPPPTGHNWSALESIDALGLFVGQFSDLQEVVFDPWGVHAVYESLVERRLPMVEFNQAANGLMGPASEALYELLKEGKVVHDGDPELTQQVLHAVVRATDRGWRISRQKTTERIDAPIALAMAAYRAIASRLEPVHERASFA